MWICRCGQAPATTFYALWDWRTLPQATRWVANHVALLCDSCAEAEADPRYHRHNDEQLVRVGLTATTREALVRQVAAQLAGKARGYVPKTDLRHAASRLTRRG